MRSIHQGRCPLTSVAIKGLHIGISMPCTVRPPTGGTTFVLRGGVPCAVMGCLSPTGWYTMDVPCWWRMAKKMPHHGPAVLTHMTLSSSRWKSFLQLYERGTPCGRAHCARHTDANMHFLDGYTCQGTPSKVDKPQIKSSHQVEPL